MSPTIAVLIVSVIFFALFAFLRPTNRRIVFFFATAILGALVLTACTSAPATQKKEVVYTNQAPYLPWGYNIRNSDD